MTRDESTEGWLPAAGGGLANVSIRKRPRMPDVGGGHEYIIYGQRISDQTVIIMKLKTTPLCSHTHTPSLSLTPSSLQFYWFGTFMYFFLYIFQVILSCVINRDLQYYKVMPTFHHWRAGKQRNGLTFQTAADARAFDKGIIKAYDDLIDGETFKIWWWSKLIIEWFYKHRMGDYFIWFKF